MLSLSTDEGDFRQAAPMPLPLAPYLQRRLICCRRRGQPVGRVAALIHPALPALGQVGFFHCEPDVAVARRLLDTAVEWLAGQGVRQVVGPMHGGAHLPYRFMTRGFERTAFPLEPRQPEHYPALFESCGFAPRWTWHSHDVDVARASRILRAIPSGTTADSFHLDAFDPDDVQSVLRRFPPLLNAVWSELIGYAPLDASSFEPTYQAFRPLLSRGMVQIVVDGAGQDVGYGLMYPDAPHRRLVLHTTALRPEVRGRGVLPLLWRWAHQHLLEGGYESAVFALIPSDFLPHEPTREHALYCRSVS